MNKWIITTCVVGAIALAAVAWAEPGGKPGQGGRGPQGQRGAGHALQALAHNPELAKELGVTEEQIATLQAAHYENEKNEIKLRGNKDLARLEVKKLLKADTVDKEAIMAAVDTAGQASIELRKAQIGFMIQVKEVLGKDVLQKLREYGREHMREARQGGRPGPGRQSPDNRSGGEVQRGPGFGFQDNDNESAPWMQDEMMPPDDADDPLAI